MTDNGWFASAEVRFPVLRIAAIEGTVQLAPFLDFATGWNSGGNPNPNPQTLAALGMGLLLQGGDRFSARIDFGIPLVDINPDGGDRPTNTILFSVLLNLF